MMNLGGLAFLNPWVLAGLVFLPLLWFLLRVTPPAPRLIVFPAARFLAGLEPEEQTTSKTPWWILLLRLLVLALILFALARPVLNPAAALPGSSGIRIVMDNGWAAAQTWDMQTARAQDIISRAGREQREIHIVTTAPEPGKTEPFYQGPVTQAQAQSIINGLTPMPWPADYAAAAKLIAERSAGKNDIFTFWLSHGLEDGRSAALLQSLRESGEIQAVIPEKSRLPLLLRPPAGAAGGIKVRVDAPEAIEDGAPVSVQAVGRDGKILDVQQAGIVAKNSAADITFDIPETLRAQVTQIRIGGRSGAGGVILLDDQYRRKTVGIVAPQGEEEKAPLIEASFYINRALEPYADLHSGTLTQILALAPSVIILPDVGAMPPEELNALEDWVKKGGLLLRFAGPNMTQGETFLAPVKLRSGGRALDGALTWEKPVSLAPFPENSPFHGLDIPEDLKVRRQMLAEPEPGLEEKTWALLEDGTPLITADALENGLLVMVHTTATADWSDLALSGIYVQILRRTIALARTKGGDTAPPGMLQPLSVLNGFGTPEQPKGFVLPIESAKFDDTVPDSSHPPGLYGRAGYQSALNLGVRIKMPQALPASLPGASTIFYGGTAERNLFPYVLMGAFALFLADWLIMTAMQFSWRGLRRRVVHIAGVAALLLCALFHPLAAQAQSPQYANDIWLAYIKSGTPSVDETAQQGLEALTDVLTQRTSVEPAGVAALNPEEDELSFFPFIYWPVAPDQPDLSEKALTRIQNYIDHGGMILFDTRDQVSAPRGNEGGMSGGRNAQALRRLIGSLNVPPLARMHDDHVLTKSFYLLRSYPGRFDSGVIWIEEQSASGREGVSSIIIGGHDWAAAWATATGSSLRLDGGARQQELSLRFGVNLVMYALTGNYKADQVHIPHILERLGQ